MLYLGLSMNRLLLLLFLLLSVTMLQAKQADTLLLSRDSLHSYGYTEHNMWRFHPGDDPAMALPGYDDSKWKPVYTGLWSNLYPEYAKDTIGWFRIYFKIDSSIANRQLAIRITHYGASELYLDGKRVMRLGVIGGGDSVYYADPGNVPFIITPDSVGTHLLALRYQRNTEERFMHVFTNMDGFLISFSSPNSAIEAAINQSLGLTFIFIFLFGVFIALSLIHLLLYLYYKAARSNLFFSFFCLGLSLLFFLPWLIRITDSPSHTFTAKMWLLFTASLTCFSLSGFINELFGKKRWRFGAITLLCILMPFGWLFDESKEIGIYLCIGLITIVSLEAVVLTIRGIIRKTRGARIIGAGILFFTLFILFMFAIAISMGSIEIDENTIFGQVVEMVMALAILSIPISMSAYLAWSFSRVSKDLKAQLEQVQVLSAKTLEQELEKQRMLENRKEELEKEVKMRTAEVVQQNEALKTEKKKSDDLLLNILPEEIADELKEKGSSEAKYFDHVSVLFTDFVAFTKAGERMTPQELVSELHTCFKAFDEISSKYGIEKIKTIGDAYLAVAGLPAADAKHAEKTVAAGLEILDFMKKRRQQVGDKTFDIRIGIHSGSVVAGIVGMKKFAYDIWGDTVNTAARMEQNSEAGKINISQTTYELVKDKFPCTYRGQITAKNKGELNMYFVEGPNQQ